MALTALSPRAVRAQDVPTRAVRIITPSPAGAGPEAVVSVLAENLQRKTAPHRYPAFFDVPTAVADRIQADINAALAEPDLKERDATFGDELFPTTRDQFQAFIASEAMKSSDVIKRANLRLD